MGSNVMEPEDIVTYTNDRWKQLENLTTICMPLGKVHGQGLFLLSNPLSTTLPLLLVQFTLASLSILFTSLLLKPLHQSVFVAQILGGIILGPSLLGRSNKFTINAFPLRGFILLDLLSAIAYTFYFFLVGVQLDLRILKKINRKTFTIGILTVVAPIVLSEFFAFLLLSINLDMEPYTARILPVQAQAQCASASPTIAFLLTELKIINSEFGRLAMCSSTVSGLLNLIITTSMVLAGQSLRNKNLLLTTIIAGSIYTIFIIFIIRPGVLWMLRRNPVGVPMKQSHFILLLVVVLLTGFCSHASGLHLYYGPILLGLTIPAGPPLGYALVDKLEFITYWMFMPYFFAKNGLVVDVFNIKLKNYIILQSVALVAAVGKFIGAFASSLYYKIPMVDALALGLLMTTQGLLELGLFKMMKKNKVADSESFAIMCISMLIITGSVTPIIKRLYDPSRRYVVYKRRTMISAKPDSDLRVLVCLHDQDNAPPAINLLEALNPTIDSRLDVSILHLVELVGHAKPILIPHKLRQKLSSSVGLSEGVFTAFRQYEQINLDLVSVSSYTGISPRATMHDDVCMLALEKRTSLVIIPYHKSFDANDAGDLSDKAARMIMNKNVLEKAPCSVAILVDRGLLRASWTTLESWSPYRVGVVFLGGDDDREALAIGTRMAEHPNISLTIIRLVANGDVTGNDDERRLDNEFLSEFRQAMASNYRVTYIEEVVMDGSGTVAVIRSMENSYQLVLVGRSHNRRLPLLSGLEDWRERSELGTIGEIFASVDTKGDATILVVQQHNNLENEGSESCKQSLGDPDSVKDDEEEMPIQGRSA